MRYFNHRLVCLNLILLFGCTIRNNLNKINYKPNGYFALNLYFLFWLTYCSLIAQLVWTMICYEIRANASVDTWSSGVAANSLITSLAILFSLDNIWSINLSRCLDHANIYLDCFNETFSLLVLTNILLYEGSTMFDCSFIIGNQINTCLSGLMVVFTLYYQVARHLYLIFISIFV